eukprot:27269-Eustigmatos_ZCMA.PRE.1
MVSESSFTHDEAPQRCMFIERMEQLNDYAGDETGEVGHVGSLIFLPPDGTLVVCGVGSEIAGTGHRCALLTVAEHRHEA